MRDIKKLIEKIKSAKSAKASEQGADVFPHAKKQASVPRDYTNELYLMCFREDDDYLFTEGTVAIGDYTGYMFYVAGEISYQTVLSNRGVDITAVEDCVLTLYNENNAPDAYQDDYEIYSFNNGAYIDTCSPVNGEFTIPLKKLYDMSGSCNFVMLPCVYYNGLAVFSENNYTIDITERAGNNDFYDTTNSFTNEPDYQQNYFEGAVANAGGYSVNRHDGRLSFSKTLFALDGNRLPVSLRMVYNPFIRRGIPGIFTDNWKFNFEQYVYKKDTDYIYIDNDFRRHVFKPLKNSGNGTVSGMYYDTAHSGLLLQEYSDRIIITDGRLSELKFVNNRLTEIKQLAGVDAQSSSNIYNTLTVSYNNGIISSVTDGMGRITGFAKSGSTITITMPSGYKVTITESAGTGLTVKDVNSATYSYSYTSLNGVKVLNNVGEASRRNVKFEYYTKFKIKKITVSNPKTTLATYEFTYNVNASYTDIKKTELNKSILERYSMTDEGRLIYSCELQNEKSYALSFRTKEDYDMYSAALTGKENECIFANNGHHDVNIPSDKEFKANLLGQNDSVAKDGEDVVLIANVLVDTTVDTNESIDVEVSYGTINTVILAATVKIKKIKDLQVIIVPIPRNSQLFAEIFQTVYNLRGFSFESSKTLSAGFKIFNVGYYFTNLSTNAECINQNTGSSSFSDGSTTWYKLTDPKIDGVTTKPVKMTAEDWLLSLDNYARKNTDYIVWYNERTAAVKFNSAAKFTFTGGANPYINTIRYATVSNQGINTLYDSFTYNNGSDSEYITEKKTLVRNESSMRTTSSTTCYVYYDKLYRQTNAINSKGITTCSEYDKYGNIISSVTHKGDLNSSTLNIRECYAYGSADGTSDNGQYLIQAESYMQGEPLSSKYRYEQNTGWMKNSTSPAGQTTDYTYEESGELKTLSSTLNGTTSKNELTYDIDRIKTAKHNEFVYNFTYGETYEELQTITVGNYTLCDQQQIFEHQTVMYYPDDQDVYYYTDKYGRQEAIDLYSDNYNYYESVYFKYGLPNQTNVDNAQSKILGINILSYSSGYEYEATFEYEANGNLKRLYWFDLYTLEYTYDDENRVKTQRYTDSSTTLTTEYSYWDGDALTEARIIQTVNKFNANAFSTTTDEYDGLNRLFRRRREIGIYTYMETYTYVPSTVNGTGTTYLPASFEQNFNGTFNEYFSYDANGNIISIFKNYGSYVTYEYDKFNRLIRENNPIIRKTYTYKYNKGGNITSKEEYDHVMGTTKTHSYTYDSTYKDLLIAHDGKAITYDETAHPISYKGHSLSWLFGNLVGYDDTEFEYLYDHTRIVKKSWKGTTYYDYHEGRLLGEHRSGGSDGIKDIAYLYDHSGIIGFTLNGESYRYIKNMQGDIIAIFRDNQFIAEYVYDAWGNCTITSDRYGIGAINPIRYRGYYYDVETGLYYLMSRYYDPATGRFISPDNVSYLDPETIQGLNLFAYCGNNPVMGIDPEGTWNWRKFLVAAALAIVATAVAVAVTVATGGAGLLVAATATTGVVLAGAAGSETTAVLDVSYTSSTGDKVGFSLVVDFKNMKVEGYGHFGQSYGVTSPGFGYSVGFVDNYSGKGSYGGLFVNAGVNAGVGIEHAFDPSTPYEDSVKSTTITFSNTKGTTIYGGYDIYFLVF